MQMGLGCEIFCYFFNGPHVDSITALGAYSCREDFFRDPSLGGICVPMCPAWKQDSKAISITFDVVAFTSNFIGLVTAIAVLVISIVRRHSM